MDNNTRHLSTNRLNREKKLAAKRSEILRLDSQNALNRILESDWPASLVQSFPEQDLYFLMHTIGEQDFLPILSMASFDQWEYFLDVDGWENDRINLPGITKTFELLFNADQQRFLRWIIKDKPDLLEYFLSKAVEIKLREHDQDPSDFGDGFITIDSIFYLRFPTFSEDLLDEEGGLELIQAQQASEDLTMRMLNTLADMDLSVYHALLLETGALILAETEEEQYRLKTVRLAEKGFLPHHEAIGLYQPLRQSDLKRRLFYHLDNTYKDSDLPLPPQFPETMLIEDSLFAQSLSHIDEAFLPQLQSEFAALVNRLVSADKKMVRHREDMNQAVKRACHYLSLGIECVHGKIKKCKPAYAAAVIRNHTLEDLFRIASAESMALKEKAKTWHKDSWLEQNRIPLSFLDEKWLGLLGGLLVEKPLYFDHDASGFLYRAFSCAKEINETQEQLDAIIAVDRLMSIIAPDLTAFSQGMLTYKSLVLTLWVRERLGMSTSLEPIPLERFKPFFKALFGGKPPGSIHQDQRNDLMLWLSKTYNLDEILLDRQLGGVFAKLFDELENEYGKVKSNDLDSRIITHFLTSR